MTIRGSEKHDQANKNQSSPGSAVAFEPYFLEELDPAIPYLAKNNVKLCVDAGASNVAGLAEVVRSLVKKHGVDLKVGYVDGDDVTDVVLDLVKKGQCLSRCDFDAH